MAAASQVVMPGMDHDGAPDYVSFASAEFYEMVHEPGVALTLGVGTDVAKIADVPDHVGAATVVLVQRIKMRAHRSAPFCQVTRLVDVQSVDGMCRQSPDRDIDKDLAI